MAHRRRSDRVLNQTWLAVGGLSIALSLYAIYTVYLVQSVASGIKNEMEERSRARSQRSLPFDMVN